MKPFSLLLFLVLLTRICTVSAQESENRQPITLDNAASVAQLAALEGHEGAVNSVAFSPDGTLLASGGEDGSGRVWNIDTESEPILLEGNTGPINALAFSPDGTNLASGGDTSNKVLLVWDVRSGEVLGTIQVQEQYIGLIEWAHNDQPAKIYSVVFVPSESSIFAAGEILSRFFWHRDAQQSASVNNQWSGSDPDIMSISFSPDGAFVAMGRSDGLFIQVESTCCVEPPETSIDNSVPLAHLTDIATRAVTFNSDGSILASGGGDGAVQLWAITEMAQESLTELTGHADTITSVAFSPDGTLLVSSSLDGTLRLWNVEAQAEIAVLSGDEGVEYRAVAFSPDGSLIASAGSDGIVRLWGVGEAETGDEGNQSEISTETTEIVTSFGTMTVNSAKFIDAYPEGCDPNVTFSCFAVPTEGMKILIVYFDGVSDENAFTDQHENAHVTDANGNQFEADLYGFDAGLNFYGFAVPESAPSVNDFSLVWNDGDEVVIPLVLEANDSSD